MPLLRLLTSGLRINDGPQSSAYTASPSKNRAKMIPPSPIQQENSSGEDVPSPPPVPGSRRKSRLGTTLHLKPKAEISTAEKERVYISGPLKMVKGKCIFH